MRLSAHAVIHLHAKDLHDTTEQRDKVGGLTKDRLQVRVEANRVEALGIRACRPSRKLRSSAPPPPAAAATLSAWGAATTGGPAGVSVAAEAGPGTPAVACPGAPAHVARRWMSLRFM